MISIESKGDFDKTIKSLRKLERREYTRVLNAAGARGVAALASATPKDSGLTANSWSYEIEKSGNKISLIWTNSNVQNGTNIAIILQYGHGTGTGGYVQGRDYINPAIKPIMDDIAKKVGEELRK